MKSVQNDKPLGNDGWNRLEQTEGNLCRTCVRS